MDAPEKSGSGKESEFGLRCQCHGAYKRKRGRFIPADVPDILFIPNTPTLLFDDASGGQLPGRRGVKKTIWSCLSAKCTDGRLLCIKWVNNDPPDSSMNASPIIPVIQNASSRTSMQTCARKYMESSGVQG